MLQYSLARQIWKRLRYQRLLIELLDERVSDSSRTGPSMVATIVISSTAFLAVDPTYRSLDIMLLEMVMALVVKVTCRGGNHFWQRGQHLAAVFRTFGTQFEGPYIFGICPEHSLMVIY